MHRPLMLAAVLTFGTFAPQFVVANNPADTVLESEQVLSELMTIPAKQIPQRLMDDAQGIVIIPNVIKIGFIAGGRRGHGVVLVRDADGEWSLPQFVTLTGGSVGWQAGIQGTDVILVFTTRKGVEGLLRGKFTVGVDASVTAGPIGREAEIGTDATLRSEIYSYSRSRGLFLGVSLDGSALEIDYEAHNFFYGSRTGELPRRTPSSADQLRHFLAEVTSGHAAAPAVGGQAPNDRPAPVVPVRRLEAIRRSLNQNSAQLQAILSPEWRPYLALPKELLEPGHPVHLDSLATALKHFAQVNTSPDYQQLTERTEFQNTYELLREYEQALKSTRGALQLPPPPPHSNRE